MFKFLPKIILPLIFWGIFIYIIFNISYPNSLTEATFFQLLSFFLSLFLAIISTINIFLTLIISTIISLGLILLLILKGFGLLNIVTAILTLVAVGLLLSYFRNINSKGISFKSQIPKLKLSNKFKQVKLTRKRKRYVSS